MAVVLALIAAVLLVLAAVVGPDNPSLPLRLLSVLALWTGPVVLFGLAVVLARRRVAGVLRRVLISVAGPALIRAMPPRTVLDALLPWIYGPGGHQDVLVGVLGGAGRDPQGRDTAVSRATTAEFRLWSIDDVRCVFEATWTHEFSGVRQAHKFVVFGTADPAVAHLVAKERVHPLFEVWLCPDEEQLEDFVPNLRRTLDIGMTYVDASGSTHDVAPRSVPGEEVALRDYDRFVRLGDVDRKDLRIVEFDLWDLADPDHVVEFVETLSFRAVSLSYLDLGFITWSPPHPCFMRSVVFDVADLAPEGRRFVYLALPFTMKYSAITPAEWTAVQDRIELSLDAWMLPGHGVTLLWRAAE